VFAPAFSRARHDLAVQCVVVGDHAADTTRSVRSTNPSISPVLELIRTIDHAAWPDIAVPDIGTDVALDPFKGLDGRPVAPDSNVRTAGPCD
jgi:hypothetical protein